MVSPFRVFALCLTLGLALVAGCQQQAEQAPVEAPTPPAAVSPLPVSDTSADPVVVTVNDEEIRRSDLIRQMNLMAQQGMRVNPQQVLDQSIAERLLAQAAVETGHVAAASAVQETYESIVAQVGGEATLEMHLANTGSTLEELKKDLERQLNIQAVVDWKTADRISVPDASVEAYYSDNPQSFERVQARHILIRSAPDDPPEERAEARRRIEQIAERLKAGEDFAEVAREESEDPGSAAEGGDLGEFGRGRMVPAFEEAAFRLESGSTSDIVESQFGYHIIQVQEHQTTPLEEVEDRLRSALENQQRQEIIRNWLKELEEKASIDMGTSAPAPGLPPPAPPAAPPDL